MAKEKKEVTPDQEEEIKKNIDSFSAIDKNSDKNLLHAKNNEIYRIAKMLIDVNGYNVANTHAYLVSIFGKENIPCYQYFLAYMREHGIVEDHLEEVKENIEKRTTEEIFSDLGFDKSKRIQYLCEMIDKGNQVFKIIGDVCDGLDAQKGEDKSKSLDKRMYRQLMSTYTDVTRVSLAALQESSKLCGDYQPEKTEHTIRDKSNSGSYGSRIKNMDLDEMKMEEMRLIKLKSEQTGVPIETLKKIVGIE